MRGAGGVHGEASAEQCRKRTQRALDRLARWCGESLMEVNTEKSEYILLVPTAARARGQTPARPPVRVTYKGEALPYRLRER